MARSLPLGIDIGTSRLRIVHMQTSAGVPRVIAVAVRNLPLGSATSGAIADIDVLGGAIADAWAELGTRERRCVLAVGMPDAQVQYAPLPAAPADWDRAARAAAQSYVDYPIEEAVVRTHPTGGCDRAYAFGIVRGAALQSRLKTLAATPLRAIAVDHESLALQRALPDYDAVLDIGFERTSLHVLGAPIPITMPIPGGGESITREIERELMIDARSAESRKRTHGVNGAGEAARDRLIAEVVGRLQAIDPRGQRVQRLALVGNGARLHELGADLERLCARRVDLATSATLCGDAYPPDVAMGAAPDWNLAAGLSLWSEAA